MMVKKTGNGEMIRGMIYGGVTDDLLETRSGGGRHLDNMI